MAQANDPPHQTSYEDVCKLIGRLYLESHVELERLRDMLCKQQTKLSHTEQQLKESQELITKLMNNGTST